MKDFGFLKIACCGNYINFTILEVRKKLILWELKVLWAEGQSHRKVLRKK